MFRKTTWRKSVSDTVSFHQDQALNTTIFLLKSFGPTGFLLQQDGETRDFKVCLGDPHTCTCPVFTREQEPCKHICWVLLRKFRLPREHEYSFQHGLVERQILELLHGLHQRMENDPSAASGTSSQQVTDQEAGSVCRKVIQAQDVCPICQEELLEKKQPVSYCRFGCGNNVHISCMKVWSDHQKLSDREETVKCPLCREVFSSLKLLQEQVKNAAKLFTSAEREKPDKHLGLMCHICRVCPVTGTCFKCTVCSFFYLCEDCSKKNYHPQHQLASRTKRRGRWRLVTEADGLSGASTQPGNDSVVSSSADSLPEHALDSLPAVRVRPGSRLLDEGLQCRMCLQSFALGQRVRHLPCHHKFHTDCVDGILRKSNRCPLDGYVIYNPLTWRSPERKTSHQLAPGLSSDFAKPENKLKDLFIPGVALRDRSFETAPSHGPLNLEVLTASPQTLNVPRKLISDQFVGLCIASADDETKAGKGASHKKQKPSPAKCSSASSNVFVPAAKIRAQPQLDLRVGVCGPESGHMVTGAFPVRPIRLQPGRKGPVTTRDTNNKLSTDVRVDRARTTTQHHWSTEH